MDVTYTVTSIADLNAKVYLNAQEAANAFHAVCNKDRPCLIRVHRDSSGSECASILGGTSVTSHSGALNHGKWLSDRDPELLRFFEMASARSQRQYTL